MLATYVTAAVGTVHVMPCVLYTGCLDPAEQKSEPAFSSLVIIEILMKETWSFYARDTAGENSLQTIRRETSLGLIDRFLITDGNERLSNPIGSLFHDSGQASIVYLSPVIES